MKWQHFKYCNVQHITQVPILCLYSMPSFSHASERTTPAFVSACTCASHVCIHYTHREGGISWNFELLNFFLFYRTTSETAKRLNTKYGCSTHCLFNSAGCCMATKEIWLKCIFDKVYTMLLPLLP